MYAYSRPLQKVTVLPYTNGRIVFTDKLVLLDMYKKDVVPEIELHGVACADLSGTDLGTSRSPEEIQALIYMPVYLPLEDFNKLWLESLNGKRYWNYPEGGIECKEMPGFYYIPEFSRYVINKKGEVYSLQSGQYKDFFILSTGYLGTRLTRDDGFSKIMTRHRLMGMTFMDYQNVIAGLVIDHLDCNKLNNSLDNFEWVEQAENVRRGILHARHARAKTLIMAREIPDGEIFSFESMHAAARHFDVSTSSIYYHLNNPTPNAVYKGKYLVWYDTDVDGGVFTKEHEEVIKKSSHSKKVLAKNVETGEITVYSSGQEFHRASGISKKRIFSCLTPGIQKVVDGLVFKYETDPSDWIA